MLVYPMEGGEPRSILAFPNPPFFASLGSINWTPDGLRILFSRKKHEVGFVLCQFDVKGETQTELGIVTAQGEISIHPSGRKIVFAGEGRGSELWAVEGLDVSAAVLPQQAQAHGAAQAK